MFPRIIGALVSLLCATPFYALALGRSDPHTPIPFWSGDDDKLRDKLSDIPAYNREMAALYTRFAGVLLANALIAGVWPGASFVLLIAELAVGLFLIHRRYKALLAKYSSTEPRA